MATRHPSVSAELTSGQVLGWRLERQLVDPIGGLDVRETVRALAGIQAQVQLLDPVQGGAFLALLATTRRWEGAAWQATFGVGPAELENVTGIVREALDGRILTREQVIEAVLEGTGNRDLEEHMRSGWGGILKPLT
jgi:hypothetical protein